MIWYRIQHHWKEIYSFNCWTQLIILSKRVFDHSENE